MHCLSAAESFAGSRISPSDCDQETFLGEMTAGSIPITLLAIEPDLDVIAPKSLWLPIP